MLTRLDESVYVRESVLFNLGYITLEAVIRPFVALLPRLEAKHFYGKFQPGRATCATSKQKQQAEAPL